MKCGQHNEIKLCIPEWYVARSEWADKLISKWYRQRKCPDCWLYCIRELWLKREYIKWGNNKEYHIEWNNKNRDKIKISNKKYYDKKHNSFTI